MGSSPASGSPQGACFSLCLCLYLSLWGIYHLATDRNDFWRHLIVIVELFAMGVWLARNLKDIDPMAPQPGV
uniref:Uncharacterized protein n=2 Tax=Canis lupus familiaris TaxID=9615 RepID=A0A8C0N8T3_CANLF